MKTPRGLIISAVALVLPLLAPPLAVAADFETESLTFNMVEAGNDGMIGPVSTSQILELGSDYDVTISGTVSVWKQSEWDEAGGCKSAAIGTTGGITGMDAEFVFAVPQEAVDVTGVSCSELPSHTRESRIQFDAGSGFTHPEPVGGAVYAADHTYHYRVSGQDATLKFGWFDSPTDDNYGTLTITVAAAASTAADLCLKLVAQKFDGSAFAEHNSCDNTAAGTLEFMWHQDIPLLIEVTNKGPDTATNVRIEVTLSSGLRFSYTREPVCGDETRVRTCRFGSIESGISKQHDRLRVTGVGTSEAQALEIRVDLTSTVVDPEPGNDDASVTTTVLPGGADLSVSASGPSRAEASSRKTYRVTLVNNGPKDAKAVSLRAQFKYGTGYLRTFVDLEASRGGCEQYPSSVSCDFRRLVKGQANEVVLRITIVVPGEPGRQIKLVADIHTTTPDPNRANNVDRHPTTII